MRRTKGSTLVLDVGLAFDSTSVAFIFFTNRSMQPLVSPRTRRIERLRERRRSHDEYRRNIERGGIDGCRACVTAARDVAPHLNAAALEVAGGIAGFAGKGSPLSEACGLGVFENVTPDDVAQMTQFYLERGAVPRVLVARSARWRSPTRWSRDGYRPVEYQNVFVREIAGERRARTNGSPSQRIIDAWGHASASGFLDREAGGDEALVGTIVARAATMIPLEARVDGAVVATAAMDVRGEIAGLHGASTMPSARRRGWQNILIRDRAARARELGARYVYGVADVGGTSERNFRRAVLRVLLYANPYGNDESNDFGRSVRARTERRRRTSVPARYSRRHRDARRRRQQ